MCKGGAAMRKKECLAMILAGGKGSRLGVLTKNVAKPAVLFGGKYRIIDFTSVSYTHLKHVNFVPDRIFECSACT